MQKIKKYDKNKGIIIKTKPLNKFKFIITG